MTKNDAYGRESHSLFIVQPGFHFILHGFLNSCWYLSQFLVNPEASGRFRDASKFWRIGFSGSMCSSNSNIHRHGKVPISEGPGIVCAYKLCHSGRACYEKRVNYSPHKSLIYCWTLGAISYIRTQHSIHMVTKLQEFFFLICQTST